ncbi:cell wall hydrolase/autolysin [Caldithrix abyssi DSM 13497]|uniref:N-acetylmuramoyl-L-alanine amidase n=1 Tax=Caldithrix abyssi DSM 13497 TaxID=880073 RepID=H1XXV8_CALAY|nr:N-acetylmuramoyl-L-alanine amidase [Caldithrix abyssi]APF19666.1 N-acetylmuramoyl-L-alanine amidase [Caldithrix abyssi DSM 13497]EHO39781.1 cell wall hydrolase/autolysin [Caldithrix abyssi DSM 13497]
MKFQNYFKFVFLTLLFTLFIALPFLQAQTASTITILIDPGHGGKDPGYVWSADVQEKNIAMLYAQELARQLQNQGFATHFTHQSADSFVRLEKRVKKIDQARADAFITIHLNPTTADSQTVELLISDQDTTSAQLPRSLQAALIEQNINTSISKAKLFVLRYATAPAVMVNLRCGKSAKSVSHWQNATRRKQICQALALGLTRFFHENPVR